MRTSLFSVGWGLDTSILSLCQTCCSQFTLLFAAHIYSGTVEAEAKGQAIVLDPQERRTVVDCGHNA